MTKTHQAPFCFTLGNYLLGFGILWDYRKEFIFDVLILGLGFELELGFWKGIVPKSLKCKFVAWVPEISMGIIINHPTKYRQLFSEDISTLPIKIIKTEIDTHGWKSKGENESYEVKREISVMVGNEFVGFREIRSPVWHTWQFRLFPAFIELNYVSVGASIIKVNFLNLSVEFEISLHSRVG